MKKQLAWILCFLLLLALIICICVNDGGKAGIKKDAVQLGEGNDTSK